MVATESIPDKYLYLDQLFLTISITSDLHIVLNIYVNCTFYNEMIILSTCIFFRDHLCPAEPVSELEKGHKVHKVHKVKILKYLMLRGQ